MNNIVDLDSFRKKKAQLVVAQPELEPLPTIPITPRIKKFNDILTPDGVDPQFHRDGLQFKFLRMASPGFFAVLNTSKLPDPFPSDPLPPMVA
jgi:hypothetical protein